MHGTCQVKWLCLELDQGALHGILGHPVDRRAKHKPREYREKGQLMLEMLFGEPEKVEGYAGQMVGMATRVIELCMQDGALIEVIAKAHRRFYTNLMKSGFSSDEAIAILLAHINRGVGQKGASR